MATKHPPIRIGTSGWHYDGWIGPFYPQGTPKKDLLRALARRFATVEINSSFYRLPSEKAVAAWHDQVSDGFLFAWKASRFVTHNKKLVDAADSVVLVMDRMAGLGERFGPVLWQLPPNLKPDRDRLGRFLDILPRRRRHVVEFRDPRWYEPAIFQLLTDHDVALAISDHHDAPAPFEVTARHAYLRAHGPQGDYRGRYPGRVLSDWAERCTALQQRGIAVFGYFDNDQQAAAPLDAEVLMARIRRRGGRLAETGADRRPRRSAAAAGLQAPGG